MAGVPRECSIAATLQVVGDKWSLLAIRELAYGVHRFDGIAANTGAPRDILTARLRKLEAEGLLERRRYHERPARFEYHLTAAGRALGPVLLALKEWGDRHADDPTAAPFVHTCGQEFHPLITCRACGEPVRRGELAAAGREGGLAV